LSGSFFPNSHSLNTPPEDSLSDSVSPSLCLSPGIRIDFARPHPETFPPCRHVSRDSGDQPDFTLDPCPSLLLSRTITLCRSHCTFSFLRVGFFRFFFRQWVIGSLSICLPPLRFFSLPSNMKIFLFQVSAVAIWPRLQAGCPPMMVFSLT